MPEEIDSQDTFAGQLEQARAKCARVKLNDQELFVLTCGELMRTYTLEEKGYT